MALTHHHHHRSSAEPLTKTCGGSKQSSASTSPSNESNLKKVTTKKTTQKTVSFFESVAVRPVMKYEDYTQEEKSNSWYNKSEMQRIKAEVKALVINFDMQHDTNNDPTTTKMEQAVISSQAMRGLEYLTAVNAEGRTQRRKYSKKLVLKEQYRQKSMDDYDPDYLAYIYGLECLGCSKSAQQVGEQDERIARQQQL